MIRKLGRSAEIPEDAFADEYGLQRCEAENNAARKPACEYSSNDLGYLDFMSVELLIFQSEDLPGAR